MFGEGHLVRGGREAEMQNEEVAQFISELKEKNGGSRASVDGENRIWNMLPLYGNGRTGGNGLDQMKSNRRPGPLPPGVDAVGELESSGKVIDVGESMKRGSSDGLTKKSSIGRKRRADAESSKRDSHLSYLSSTKSQEEEEEEYTDMSLPEKKREREKRRREVLNSRFTELSMMLRRTVNGKADKESVLAEAVETLKKYEQSIRDLTVQNKGLKTEIEELRTEKSELRGDKNYLRAELDTAREEVKTLRADHMMLCEVLKQRMNETGGGGPWDSAMNMMRNRLSDLPGPPGASSTNPNDGSKMRSHNECA